MQASLELPLVDQAACFIDDDQEEDGPGMEHVSKGTGVNGSWMKRTWWMQHAVADTINSTGWMDGRKEILIERERVSWRRESGLSSAIISQLGGGLIDNYLSVLQMITFYPLCSDAR